MAIRDHRNGQVRDEAWRQVYLSSKAVDEIGEEQGLWYETPEEIASKLQHGRMRAVRMRWVRRQMGRRLNAHERHCVELYYLAGMSFREVGERMGMTRSAAMREVRGAIEKLRTAASISSIGPDGTGLDGTPNAGE